MTKIETLGDGKKVIRDEYGRFVKVELDSETAAAMGRRAYQRKKETTASTLLEEAGYANESDAPEHLKILAQIASSKRSGAVAAMRDFLRLTQNWEPTSELAAADNVREVELIGGSDFLVKFDGVLYRKVGQEAAELARMIRDVDVIEEGETSEAAAT